MKAISTPLTLMTCPASRTCCWYRHPKQYVFGPRLVRERVKRSDKTLWLSQETKPGVKSLLQNIDVICIWPNTHL